MRIIGDDCESKYKTTCGIMCFSTEGVSMDDGIVVLSLFDGISCGRVALERAGIKVKEYYASEIDKHAITVSKDNWKDIIHIGDVTKVSFCKGLLHTEVGDFEVGKVDLLIGGSPCQDFSIARTFSKQITGLSGERSSLFYHYLRILHELKEYNTGIKFILENVKMKTESKDSLDKYLEVKGVPINSSLVSYQIRHRIYWTNIAEITPPKDKHISFQDYKETSADVEVIYKLNRTPSRERSWCGGVGRNNGAGSANVTYADKIYCLTTKQDRTPNSGLVEFDDFCRYLTREELEQAQTLPVGYTKSISYNQACACLGNGWTVDVIAHILKELKL